MIIIIIIIIMMMIMIIIKNNNNKDNNNNNNNHNNNNNNNNNNVASITTLITITTCLSSSTHVLMLIYVACRGLCVRCTTRVDSVFIRCCGRCLNMLVRNSKQPLTRVNNPKLWVRIASSQDNSRYP